MIVEDKKEINEMKNEIEVLKQEIEKSTLGRKITN